MMRASSAASKTMKTTTTAITSMKRKKVIQQQHRLLLSSCSSTSTSSTRCRCCRPSTTANTYSDAFIIKPINQDSVVSTTTNITRRRRSRPFSSFSASPAPSSASIHLSNSATTTTTTTTSSSSSSSTAATAAATATATATAPTKQLRDSPDDVWLNLTERLLLVLQQTKKKKKKNVNDLIDNNNIGAAASTTRIVPTLRWWIQQRPITYDSVKTLFQLWELYCYTSTHQHDEKKDQAISAGGGREEKDDDEEEARLLLEGILDHWYVGICDNKQDKPFYYSPLEVYEQVLKPLVATSIVSAKSVALVLSGMGQVCCDDSTLIDHVPVRGMEILDFYLLSSSKKKNHREDFENENDSLVVACNAALTLWSKSLSENAGGEAMKLLRRMQNELNIEPNIRTYACVLQALAGGGSASLSNPNAAQQAIDLFDEMIMQTRTFTGDVEEYEQQHLKIDVCALHLLTALTRCGRVDDAYDRLQYWINEWQQHQGEGGNIAATTTSTIIKPTPHLFSVVMSNYAKKSVGEANVEKVHDLLLQLHHFVQQQQQRDSDDDPVAVADDDSTTIINKSLTTALNNVLEAYANNNQPTKAESILDHLLESESNWIDMTSLNIVINAWARVSSSNTSSSRTYTNDEQGHNDAVERAEATLTKAIDYGYEPDVISYTTVMKAWARSDRKESPDRCEAFLRAMWDNTAPADVRGGGGGSSRLQPTSVTYATVLYAHSRSSSPEAPLRAEAVFNDQIERYNDAFDTKLEPVEQTYVTLMTVWNRHASKQRKGKKGSGSGSSSSISQAAARSQYYFDTWRANCIAKDIPLTNRPYNALLESKKRIGDGVGAERILQNILNDWDKGNHHVKPTRYTFQAVLEAHAAANDNSRSLSSPKAPEQAERFLNRMEKWSKRGKNDKRWRTIDCKPNTVMYATVIQCWSKVASKRNNAPDRAQALLRRMEERARTNGGGGGAATTVRPNSLCYASVLQAWANASNIRPDAAERAQNLMDEMWERYYEGGEKECRPNSAAYTALLTSWSRSNREDAPFKALSLINEMHDRCNNSKSKGTSQQQRLQTNTPAIVEEERPNCLHYASVINAFAKIGDVNNAGALLERIENDPGINPNAACYHGYMLALINSSTRHGINGSSADPTETVIAEHVEDVLRKLQQPNSKVRPTPLMYMTAISAWGQQSSDAYSRPIDTNNINRAYDLLQDYIQNCQVSRNYSGPFLAYFRVVANATQGALTVQEKVVLLKEIIDLMLSFGLRPTEEMRTFLEKYQSPPSST